MPDKIRREDLTLDKLALFSDFDCGDEPWQRPVSDWIRCQSSDPSDSADKSIKSKRCKAYLYRNKDGKLIGFGTLGKSKWNWPKLTDPKIPVVIIPWIGIAKPFHGQPTGENEVRYSDQIIADLYHLAKAYGLELLVLYVDPRNLSAIKVYKRNGFAANTETLEAEEMMRMFVSLQ